MTEDVREVRRGTDGQRGENETLSAGHLLSTEEWRAVVGYEGLYEVSSLGRIRGLKSGKILRPHLNQDGYLRQCLRKDGKTSTPQAIHRLVCIAFHGPSRPVHREVAHLDGVRTNARADNLRWVSHVENHSHKRIHGTLLVGEKHPRAKLTDDNVRAILRLLAQRWSCADIGEQFGVSGACISDIHDRKNWRHIKGPPEAYTRYIGGGGADQQRGERNHMAKLSDIQAAELRRRKRAGENWRTLAAEFGISKSVVYKIANGDTYKLAA